MSASNFNHLSLFSSLHDHELSFVLVIKDDEYLQQKFYGNDEGVNRAFIPNVTLSNFEKRDDIWSNLHRPSAAMWSLFKESKVYKEILEESSR